MKDNFTAADIADYLEFATKNMAERAAWMNTANEEQIKKLVLMGIAVAVEMAKRERHNELYDDLLEITNEIDVDALDKELKDLVEKPTYNWDEEAGQFKEANDLIARIKGKL